MVKQLVVFLSLVALGAGIGIWFASEPDGPEAGQPPLEQGLRVDNFQLLDQHGKAHELYYHRDASAIVLMVHGIGCPVVRNSLADFAALSRQFARDNVRFFYLNSNAHDDREAIAREAQEWSIDIPVLSDQAQLIGPSLALTRTAEVLVIDPATWRVVFRGPLNNRVSYQRQQEAASEHYASDAIDALLAGHAVPQTDRELQGCLINWLEDDPVTYAEDIAPLLQRHCLACHSEGGIAPWAMSQYEIVRGFAPMLREVVRTGRMPPWFADPLHGEWREGQGLSALEKRQLVRWVEEGALQGEGRDPLQELTGASQAWRLGEPDLVVEIPAQEVPASGVIDIQYPVVPNPLDTPRWIVAAQVMPGDRKALHHMYAGIGTVDGSSQTVRDSFIVGWSPGLELGEMPAGTGVYLPADAAFLFEMHYTAYGKATVDRTRIGLYFAEQPPQQPLRYGEVINQLIDIPANARDHIEQAYYDVTADMTLHTLVPHSHYRAYATRYSVRFPDGSREILLSVPAYDFNWQRSYSFATPRRIPAGSRIEYTTWFDNSRHNLANPDPGKRLFWGLQSEDEMVLGVFLYTLDGETVEQQTYQPRRDMIARQMGFLDRNQDGLLERSEVPAAMQRMFYKLFFKGDQDADQKLSLREWLAAEGFN